MMPSPEFLNDIERNRIRIESTRRNIENTQLRTALAEAVEVMQESFRSYDLPSNKLYQTIAKCKEQLK